MSAQTLEEFCDSNAPNVLICANLGTDDWVAIVQKGEKLGYFGRLGPTQYEAISPERCMYGHQGEMHRLANRYRLMIVRTSDTKAERFPEERNVTKVAKTSNEFEVVVVFKSARAASAFYNFIHNPNKDQS